MEINNIIDSVLFRYPLFGNIIVNLEIKHTDENVPAPAFTDGNCKYHKYEDISQGWICCNKDSEYIADWTDYTDCCEEWESR